MTIVLAAMGAFALALIPLEVWREWYDAGRAHSDIGVIVGLVAAPVFRDIIPTLSSAMVTDSDA